VLDGDGPQEMEICAFGPVLVCEKLYRFALSLLRVILSSRKSRAQGEAHHPPPQHFFHFLRLASVFDFSEANLVKSDCGWHPKVLDKRESDGRAQSMARD
jgi:hypothetical protein